MSTLGSVDARWLLVVAPLLAFGCGDDEGIAGDDDDDSPGCLSDDDCRRGSFCIDREGDHDGFCDEGETCECVDVSTGGSGGSSTGGSSNGGTDGGNGEGGASEGGSTAGGSSNRRRSSTGGSSGDTTCGAYCTRFVGAMCGAATEPGCLSQCEELDAACPAELPELSACVAEPSHPVTCDGTSTVIDGCGTEIEALDRCLSCVADSADTACVSCSKTDCCEELGDYTHAPDYVDFVSCTVPCTTQPCLDGCGDSYPIAGSAQRVFEACQKASCAEPCVCGALPSDGACRVCYKMNCCSEYMDYVLAPDITDFRACIDPCPDLACVRACADEFPSAGAAFFPWNECALTECPDTCGS